MSGLRNLIAVLLLFATPPALAVMSGEESPLERSFDTDYADGKEAFLAENWSVAIAALEKVIARRPWHDNAHNMLGFSWRKLGNFDRALDHYDKALELNPRHRGALEYRGEAYLELGRVEEASADFRRLTEICAPVVTAAGNQSWESGCEELTDLKEAFAEHGVPLPAK